MKALLERHEGRKTRPYTDTVGKTTIGVGRNLDDRGLYQDEIDLMLENDIKIALGEIELYFPWVGKFTKPRQMVMVNMCFNMGIKRLRGFKKMLMALAVADYDRAADEMLDSAWATQVKGRSTELANMMRVG